MREENESKSTVFLFAWKSVLQLALLGCMEAAMWTLIEDFPKWALVGTIATGLIVLLCLNTTDQGRILRIVAYLSGALYVAILLVALVSKYARTDPSQNEVSVVSTLPVRQITDHYVANVELQNFGKEQDRSFFMVTGPLYTEPDVSPSSEADALRRFDAYYNAQLEGKPPQLPTLGTNEKIVQTAAGPTASVSEMAKFKSKEEVFFLLATASFSNNGGYHETHVCSIFVYDSLPVICHRHNDKF